MIRLFVIAALLLAQQALDGGGIEGTVTRRVTGEPIFGVRVTLSAVTTAGPRGSTPNQTEPIASTDSQGRFAFAQIPPGSYRLIFSRNGYVREQFGINVTSRQIVRGSLQMTPTAVVTGRVHDVVGAPAVGVPVELVRLAEDAKGNKTLQRVASVRTDDHGEYRLFYISPGHYFVRANTPGPLSNVMAPGLSPNPFALSFDATFYPAAADVMQAVPIDLAPDAELNGIDIAVRLR